MYSVFIVGGGTWKAALSLTILYGIIFSPLLWIDNQLQEIQDSAEVEIDEGI